LLTNMDEEILVMESHVAAIKNRFSADTKDDSDTSNPAAVLDVPNPVQIVPSSTDV